MHTDVGYSEFDPIGDTESEIIGVRKYLTLCYSEFDPIGDTERRSMSLAIREVQSVTASSIR